MRKLLLTILLFVAYIWVMSSGHDQMVIRHGKNIYNALVSWFDDADVDFQVRHQTPKNKHKKKSRRWD